MLYNVSSVAGEFEQNVLSIRHKTCLCQFYIAEIFALIKEVQRLCLTAKDSISVSFQLCPPNFLAKAESSCCVTFPAKFQQFSY